MAITTIVIPAFLVAVAGLVVGFFIKNKEKDVEKPIIEPEKPKEPKEKQEEKEEEKEKQQPDEPDKPAEDEEKPAEKENKVKVIFEDLIEYFSQVVSIPKDGKTYQYLSERSYLCEHATSPRLYNIHNFPYITNYYTDTVNPYRHEQTIAWLFGMILSELVPEKRSEIYALAYDYKTDGSEQPTYGWSFETDPNIARMIASYVYSISRQPEKIEEMREELGGKKIKYKDEIDECFIDLTGFMPHAPGPYLDDHREYPVNADPEVNYNLKQDQEIHNMISDNYYLGTKYKHKNESTIQSIANKDGDVLHIFGGDRNVEDPEYGQMTIHPVFGKHNLGIEIPTDGAIAKLVELAYNCSYNRKSLLDQEYGRRRPGMGRRDATCNQDPDQRVLVNYAIEEGDGHTTGYYNADGDYISYDGTHIGDYVTYFQKELWSNSYPSGHSAFIQGLGVLLTEVMPYKADCIEKAVNEFALSRTICRYHWNSDTIHGRVIGSMFVPIMHSITNLNVDKIIEDAKKEYETLKEQNK